MATLAEHLAGRARRLDERQDVLLDATVRAYRMPALAASLLDLSEGGAMCRGDAQALHKGDEIVLDAAGKQIVATVAWSNESFFGLSFHRRLDTREMSWLKRVGRA
jgi:hypothetical protein